MGWFSDNDNQDCDTIDCSIRESNIGSMASTHARWQCGSEADNGPSWASKTFESVKEWVKEARETGA